MTELRLHNVHCSLRGATVLRDISLVVRPGQLTVLLGPNGAGKTSLMRVALGLIAPDNGSVELDGRDLKRITPIERARTIAYLPQMRPLAWPMLVDDIVALGRFAFGAAPGRLGSADDLAVKSALVNCRLEHLAHRPADTLSGGELARVHVARALAGETPLLLADEPVASLDPSHQHGVMQLFRSYVDRGGGALIIVHDLNLAARYADRLVWMVSGQIVCEGSVADTMTHDQIARVFGVEAELVEISDRRHVLLNGVIVPGN